MSAGQAEELLQRGVGVWLRGPPGSGRTHRLRMLASGWPGAVVWVREPAAPWLGALPESALLVVDDAPSGLCRDALPAGVPALATGPAPGAGWTVLDLEPVPQDDGVKLFLEHAPGAGPPAAVHALVRRLGGHPTAILAAARRWPEAPLDAILRDPSPAWPGLRAAWEALPLEARSTLALLARLPGSARREGLLACGAGPGLGPLIGAGWVRVPGPDTVELSLALAGAVWPWQEADTAPYLDWFADEARRRVAAWDRQGGARSWFQAGLWPLLWERHRDEPAPWLLRGWALSGQAPDGLLLALVSCEGRLCEVLSARCAARALQATGNRSGAVAALELALAGPAGTPVHRAFARLELGVAHHRLRQLDAAAAAYRAAEAELDAVGMARGRVLALSNLAAVDHDRGRLPGALAGYRRAISEAAVLGDRRLEGIFSSNLGALLLEQDEPEAARIALRQAVRCLGEQRDDRLLAIARVNLAAVELLGGHLDAADAHYADALALLRDEDPASSALCHARRGAVAALQDRLPAARRHHQEAERLVPEHDPVTSEVVALWRVFLEWQAGDRASALARRRAALAGEPPLVEHSDEARLVVRLLERAARAPGAALLVGAGGAWVRVPGGERVDVARYGAAARILEQLASVAESAPGESCGAEQLIAAGWPGEQILPAAAKNRLGVALARLRKLGLRDQLQRTAAGWRLDPDWSVLLLRGEGAPG